VHPNTHFRAALQIAEEHGWRFTKSRGDALGRIGGDHGSLWVCHRVVEMTQRVREALEQVRSAGLRVAIENTVFA
jgi:hypothetical protein